MQKSLSICFCLILAGSVSGQSPEPPLSDSRLSIHTLVREDIFAGWRRNDMERFARGEKNIDILLEQRPNEKADLLSWKGAASLYRAVLAHEAGDEKGFEQRYKEALRLFQEARKAGPQSPGSAAVIGGGYVMFADRLPEQYRAAAWSECYDSYERLRTLQADVVDKLPLHLRGELLAGLAQSAQRTGRRQVMDEYLSKIITDLPDSPYGRVAKKWKDDPQSAATTNMSCKTCHASGRLAARIAANGGR